MFSHQIIAINKLIIDKPQSASRWFGQVAYSIFLGDDEEEPQSESELVQIASEE